MSNQTTVVEGVLLDDDAQNDPDLNSEFYDFIESAKGADNAGGTIKVLRVPVDTKGNPNPKALGKSQLFTVPVGAASFEEICNRAVADHMEPGAHMMWIQILATRDGQRGIRFNKLLKLECPVPKKEASSGAPGLQEVIALMRQSAQEAGERERRFAEMLTAARITPALPAPAVDPIAQMKSFAEIFALMSRGGAPANPANSILETLQIMKALRGFDRPDSPNKDDGEGMAKIIDAVKAIAVPLLTANAERERARAAHEQRLLAAPAKAPVDARAESDASAPKTPKVERTPEQKEENIVKLLNEIRPFLPELVAQAEKKSDPGEVAKLILSTTLDDEMSEALGELVSTPENFQRLAILEPGVKAHPEWFEALRVKLWEEFAPDEVG